MLNKKQEEATTANDRFIFLLASAGSGKTRVIIERIKYLITIKNINPEDILAISFTKKSADELSKRLISKKVRSMTFHSFCLSYIKNKSLEKDDGLSQKEKLEISKYKNSLYSIRKPSNYERYKRILDDKNSIDFDDMMLYFLMLETKPTYKYIFIDEFQDTNLLQYEVLKSLVKKTTSVFAVGDPDQSIYAFRGSNLMIINQYIKDYRAKIYTLDTNYRCDKVIIEMSNNLIRNNKKRFDKKVFASKSEQGVFNVIYTKHKYQKIIDIIKKEQDTTILVRNYKNYIGLEEYLEKEYGMYYNLMTIHQSKGLEFDKVIILGTKQMSMAKTEENLEEERRLLFVAITRAKNKVFIIEEESNKLIKELKIGK